MLNILTVLLFLVVPALMIFLCVKFKALNKLGIVLLCYIVGMVVGNLGILPHSFSTPSVTNVSVSLNDTSGEAVEVDILGDDGAVAETVTLNAENGWTQSVKLPYEDADENVITYTASDKNAVVTSSAGDSTLSLLQSITICLALPLVLFPLDIRKFFKVAKKGMLCMLLAGVSVVIVTFCSTLFSALLPKILRSMPRVQLQFTQAVRLTSVLYVMQSVFLITII